MTEGGRSISDDPDYRALCAWAARAGADPALVQAAGGNVSLKRDGVLWIKASGTWLAQAETRDIMVPVSLAPMLAALERGDAEDTTRFVRRDLNRHALRPSIETSLHGVLPHAVVVHVHCVETIAQAVQADAERRLAQLLAGLAWCFVPYVRPGPPLALAMRQRMAAGTDIVVLGNHGLVVGADTIDAAAQKVADVQRRLRITPRPAPEATPPEAEGPYQPAADPAVHATALDKLRLAVARRGSLYPDHVIFLGPGIAERPGPGPMLVREGQGVFLRMDASTGVAPLARCLADVTARLSPDDDLVTLTTAQEAELLGWDAEKYRQALNAGA